MAKKGKDGDGKATAPAGDAEPRVRLSAHPTARRHIAVAKGWGGIAGFAIVLFFSIQGGTPTPDAMLRAIIGGIGFSMLGWAAAVAVWRQLAVAEVLAARKRMEQLADIVAAEAAERAAKATEAEARAA